MANNAEDQARALAEAMLQSGRSGSFVVEVMAAYYGKTGHEAALEAIESAGQAPSDTLDEPRA
jgi:hypothetical protein